MSASSTSEPEAVAERTRLPALSSTLSLPEGRLAKWFAEEVHTHDSSLKAYLRCAFPAVRDVEDVVQESYLRIWKVRLSKPITSSKAFLFTVARNVALDLARRTRRFPTSALGDLPELDVLEDRPSAAELLGKTEKIELLGAAVGGLPDRCRAIITLHKIMGLPQREVARRLGLSEKTVENQVAIGVKRCEEFFRTHGVEYF